MLTRWNFGEIGGRRRGSERRIRVRGVTKKETQLACERAAGSATVVRSIGYLRATAENPNLH